MTLRFDDNHSRQEMVPHDAGILESAGMESPGVIAARERLAVHLMASPETPRHRTTRKALRERRARVTRGSGAEQFWF